MTSIANNKDKDGWYLINSYRHDKPICPNCNKLLSYYIPRKKNGFRFCKYCGVKISFVNELNDWR